MYDNLFSEFSLLLILHIITNGINLNLMKKNDYWHLNETKRKTGRKMSTQYSKNFSPAMKTLKSVP